MLRVTPGSAQISIVVLSGPMPASASAAATLTFAGKPRAGSRPVPVNEHFGWLSPCQPVRRLPGDHVTPADAAERCRLHRVEAQERAGRHQDPPAVTAGQL